MSGTSHLHNLLNSTGTHELKTWVQQNIGPYVGKPALESCEGYFQAYDNIQILIQTFRGKMLAIMSSGKLEPAVWFLVNDHVQRITNGDEIYCLSLYHNLLNYCGSRVEPNPPVASDEPPLPPSPKKSRLEDDDNNGQSLELLGTEVLDNLPLSLEYDAIIATIMEETDFEQELTPPTFEVPEEPILMTQPAESSESKYFGEIQAQVRHAKVELERWKKNEQWKQADFAQVRPEINESNLDSVTEIHDGIFDLMRLIPITESKKLLNEIAPNLLVVTKQPECQNDGRVISKKFDCAVRLLLSPRHLRQFNYEIKAEILNQDNCPVLRTNAGKPFKLEHNTSQFKLQTGAAKQVQTAEFSITCKEHPKRLDWIDKSVVPKTVLDENFWIRFQVELILVAIQEPLLVSEVSFPVKFVVNVSQCLQAWETLIWDNAAGSFGIRPVASRPETLPYRSVIQAINTRTYQITGRPLVNQDFDVIAKKLLRKFDEGSETEQYMSLEEFRMKISVNDLELDVAAAHNDDKNKISFWGWFFYLTKFIKVYLQFESGDKRVYSLWADMKVMGYIETQTARVILSNCAVGTFLLRFSQTTPNAIALDWIDESGIYSYRATSKDLETRNLPDRIMDISKWKYLYSLFSSDNTPKESAFISTVIGGVSFDPLNPPRHHYVSGPPEIQNFNPLNLDLKTKTAIGYVKALLQLKLLSMPGTENNL